jgi:mannitol/fructose-specific phosphotransferase system IIA component (Ntr-type)
VRKLQDYIPVERIVPIESVRREEILQRLIATALPSTSQELRDSVYRDITALSRRKELSMGSGFFLVHTRTSEVTEIGVSVGLLAREIRYRRGEPAHTVFCIIVPDSMSRTYLSMMARLSRMLSRTDAREIFLKGDPAAVVALMQEFETVETV